MSDVKKMFVGWFDYSNEEFNTILTDGLISFDTNVLLNLYRYSKETSEETLSLYESINKRLVFSYYVAEEFSKNRKKVEANSLSEYNKYISNIEKKYSDLLNELDSIPEKRISSKEKIKESIIKNKERVISSIKKEKNNKEYLFKGDLETRICNLINTNIISKYSKSDFEKIKSEGIRRVKEEIPPGFKDSQKNENGDYHIFKSLIDYCKKENKDLIFVTDDQKEDMFLELNGIKYPRPELLNEFYNESGRKILIFSVQEFLKNKVIFKESISEDLLSEIYLTSLQNSNYSTKTISRIKKYLYYIIKNNTIDDIIQNNEEIQKNLRTIVRICEGFGDLESIKKFNNLINLLKNSEYEIFLSEILNFEFIVSKEKARELERIVVFYKKTKTKYDLTIALEAINYMIMYINEYMSDDYNSKVIVFKLREIFKIINNNHDLNDDMKNEIDNAFNYIITGEEYVSI